MTHNSCLTVRKSEQYANLKLQVHLKTNLAQNIICYDTNKNHLSQLCMQTLLPRRDTIPIASGGIARCWKNLPAEQRWACKILSRGPWPSCPSWPSNKARGPRALFEGQEASFPGPHDLFWQVHHSCSSKRLRRHFPC